MTKRTTLWIIVIVLTVPLSVLAILSAIGADTGEVSAFIGSAIIPTIAVLVAFLRSETALGEVQGKVDVIRSQTNSHLTTLARAAGLPADYEAGHEPSLDVSEFDGGSSRGISEDV